MEKSETNQEPSDYIEEYINFEKSLECLWEKQYAGDIYENMKLQEQRRRKVVYYTTPLGDRNMMISLMQKFNKSLKFNHCTVHLAVYYMDCVPKVFSIERNKLVMMILVCIHLAAQIEEVAPTIPQFSEMNLLIGNTYDVREYKAVERRILQFMKFEMLRPTTASFVQLFSTRFLTRDDFLGYFEKMKQHPIYEKGSYLYEKFPRYKSYKHMYQEILGKLNKLSDYTLKITEFCSVPPSMLAAVCIAFVRTKCSMVPWTTYLQELTGYTESQIEPYISPLRLVYKEETRKERENARQLLLASQQLSGQEENKHNEPTGVVENNNNINVQQQDTANNAEELKIQPRIPPQHPTSPPSKKHKKN